MGSTILNHLFIQVADFKKEIALSQGLEYDAMTVIYSNQVRTDEMTLSDEDFVPNAPHDRCYIHIQVCDLDIRVS